MARFENILVLILGGFDDDEKDEHMAFEWVEDEDQFQTALEEVTEQSTGAKDPKPMIMIIGNTPDAEAFEEKIGRKGDDHSIALGPTFIRVPRQCVESAPARDWHRIDKSELKNDNVYFLVCKQTWPGEEEFWTKQLLFMTDY